jgi:uncharacterized membrane protein YuzA (DUF378 family)
MRRVIRAAWRSVLVLGVALLSVVLVVTAAAQSSTSVSIVPFDVVKLLLGVIGALAAVVLSVLGIAGRYLKEQLKEAGSFRETMLQWKASSEATLPALSTSVERMEEDVREVRRTVEVKIGEMGVLAETSREAAEKAQEAARAAYRLIEERDRDPGARTRRSDR